MTIVIDCLFLSIRSVFNFIDVCCFSDDNKILIKLSITKHFSKSAVYKQSCI